MILGAAAVADRSLALASGLLAHSEEGHAAVQWDHYLPLMVVGAAFLAGMAMLGRETPRDSQAPPAPVRWLTVALLFVSTAVHVPLVPAHLEEAPYMGVLFILYSVAAFSVAAVLAARPTLRWYAVAGVLSAAAIAMYCTTRLVALPQLGDDVGQWSESLGLLALAAEAGVVLLALVAYRRHLPSPARTAAH